MLPLQFDRVNTELSGSPAPLHPCSLPLRLWLHPALNVQNAALFRQTVQDAPGGDLFSQGFDLHGHNNPSSPTFFQSSQKAVYLIDSFKAICYNECMYRCWNAFIARERIRDEHVKCRSNNL